jgi:hypothetical protein
MSSDNWYTEDCETFADYKFKREQIIEDLLSALRVKRKAFEQRTITFDEWLHERRMIVRESEFHGVTSELLERLGES